MPQRINLIEPEPAEIIIYSLNGHLFYERTTPAAFSCTPIRNFSEGIALALAAIEAASARQNPA